MSDAPLPLTSADCDCTDLDGFMLNVERLMASELVALSSHEVVGAAVFLWSRAWKQLPAASLPDDERVLAAYAKLPVARFRKLRAEIMHGFVKCADGRFYHRFLAREATAAYERKIAFRKKRETDAKRLREWRGKQNETASETGEETRFVAEGQGQGQGQGYIAATQQGGAARDKRVEPHDDGPTAHSEARQACVRAIGEGHPADPVFGPVMLLIERGIPLREILAVLRSEAEARRTRGRPPIKFWSKWAEIVVERLDAAPKVVPRAQTPDDPSDPVVLLPGGGKRNESWIRKAVTRWQQTRHWPDILGSPPGKPGCHVPKSLLPEATAA